MCTDEMHLDPFKYYFLVRIIVSQRSEEKINQSSDVQLLAYRMTQPTLVSVGDNESWKMRVRHVECHVY